jgi:glutamate dehydrogenase/leucine dehydrogenase
MKRMQQQYADTPLDLRVVSRNDISIFSEECDVLIPNAVGATLNPTTIPEIKAPIVCGAANNQLEDAPRDAPALHERNVLYVPDFLANRMGIVNCANEQYGVFDDDPAITAHLNREHEAGVFRRALEVFERAKASGRTPAEEAEVLADELSQELHPIWGNRSQDVINYLVASGWSTGS